MSLLWSQYYNIIIIIIASTDFPRWYKIIHDSGMELYPKVMHNDLVREAMSIMHVHVLQYAYLSMLTYVATTRL